MSGKRNGIYCPDKRLFPRIKQCIAEGSGASVEDVLTTLLATYPEYNRKKRSTFLTKVEDICKQLDVGRGRGVAKDDDSAWEVTSDSEIELQDTVATGNMMNDFMSGIYTPKGGGDWVIDPKPDNVQTPIPVEQERDSEDTRKRPRPSNKHTKSKRKKHKHGERDGNEEREIKEEIEKQLKGNIPIINPSSRFTDFGGYDAILKDVCEVLVQFKHLEVFRHLGVAPPRGFLLHGPPGCGKTLLAHAIAGELNWPMLCLTSTEVVSGVSGESEEKLRQLFAKAKECAPCVLFIDDIDAITPKRETVQREMERRIVTQLLSCMDDLNMGDGCGKQVLVIGATGRLESLEPCLRRAGRFDREISLGIPNEASRGEILKVLLRGIRLDEEVDVGVVAHLTPGYVGADLSSLVREAAMAAVNRLLVTPSHAPSGHAHSLTTATLDTTQLSTLAISSDDFKVALSKITPSAKREGFATVPDTSWDDVGALDSVREELTMAILAPVRYPDQFSRLGLKQPQGILLAGPPGCGKTLLAKAIANESGINFISVKGPELLNMYVGESERAVRQVFQRARNSSPCVIFFDEIDALCPRRSDMAETSSSARVVNQLLTEMDGLECRKQVFLMGATNRPDIIDPAILRPGRMDKLLYVGLPNSTDRFEILNKITKNGTTPPMESGLQLSSIAADEHTSGYSGADLAALVREAACIALKEYMTLSHASVRDHTPSLVTPVADGDCIVHTRHFEQALTKVKPSVSSKERSRYYGIATGTL